MCVQKYKMMTSGKHGMSERTRFQCVERLRNDAHSTEITVAKNPLISKYGNRELNF